MTDTATELEGPDPTLSTDAADSTYAPAEVPEDNPPLGTAVEQTLGKPGSGSKSSATKKASSTSSSSGT